MKSSIPRIIEPDYICAAADQDEYYIKESYYILISTLICHQYLLIRCIYILYKHQVERVTACIKYILVARLCGTHTATSICATTSDFPDILFDTAEKTYYSCSLHLKYWHKIK